MGEEPSRYIVVADRAVVVIVAGMGIGGGRVEAFHRR
jgi:hypothetical protein